MSSFSLHLLRHGAPEAPGLLLGRTDGAPTQAGIAACLDQVADLSFAVLLSSDLRRAAEAAQALGTARRLPVMCDPRWRELDFGAWDGLAPSQVDPGSLGRFWDDPDAFPPPGGECWSALVARVAAALHDIPPRDTLVVTHGGTIRAVLATLLGFDHRQLWAFNLPYGALVSLRIWPGPQRTAQIIGLRS